MRFGGKLRLVKSVSFVGYSTKHLTPQESQELIQIPQKLKIIVKLDIRILAFRRVEEVNSKSMG